MYKYETFGCALVVFGLWGLYGATANRMRLWFGRAPRGFAGLMWREQRREASARAGRWQRVSAWAVFLGAMIAAIAHLAS
jgi:hypothetical protein